MEQVELLWDVRVALRDGTHLNATVYLPRGQHSPTPVIVALTPYGADHLHDRGMYFGAHGLTFAAVDVRGRGNSDGAFRPNIQEANDGFDVVEWFASRPHCNGQVAMFGGSYLGYAQWATAKEVPPHLATIVPTAAPFMGVDVPMRRNVFSLDTVRWLNAVRGRTTQTVIHSDHALWAALFRRRHESGRPLRAADGHFGCDSPVFQEWLDHPAPDAYWDAYNPTAEQYAHIEIPILTITGAYDGDQPGALEHYRQHVCNGSSVARARHYLIIGPWDHRGTGQPTTDIGGLRAGPDSVLDNSNLHLDWYRWTLQRGPRPAILRKNVAYYVMGSDKWRFAESLDAVTAYSKPLYLHSDRNADGVFNSGFLIEEPPINGKPDYYVYDPRNVSLAEIESKLDVATWLIDQRMILAASGRHLVYHSLPFENDVEVSGFFRLTAWLSIDRPDTDFRAWIFEIDANGASIQLATDTIRARYRESARKSKLVETEDPLRYDFDHFNFVSREIARGSRLRLVLGPVNSIHFERNYNGGGVVSAESSVDAKPVTVRLFHDAAQLSALYVPIGQLDLDDAGSSGEQQH